MSALTGFDPSETYLDVLHMGNSNSGYPAATPGFVFDGGGQNSPLKLSQTTFELDSILVANTSGLVMETGVPITTDTIYTSGLLDMNNTDVGLYLVTGTPEGSQVAGLGSIALRKDGGAGTSLYIKEADDGLNTGWTPAKITTSFLELTDTPSSYAAGKWVRVNAGGTALELATSPSAVGAFTDLTDVPSSYSGQDGKYLTVDEGSGEIVFSALPSFIASPATPTQGDILYYNGSSWVVLNAGTDGYVLTSGGAGVNPAWEEATGGSGLPSPSSEDVILISDNGSDWSQLQATSDDTALFLDSGSLTFRAPSFADLSDGPGAVSAFSNDMLYSNGSTLAFQGFDYFLKEASSAGFPSAGGKLLRYDDPGFSWVDVPSVVTQAFSSTPFATGETWMDGEVWAVVVDFGAGPDSTTKSVSAGLTTPAYDIVDIVPVANTRLYGEIHQSSEAYNAAFTFNKADQKIYCTSSSDLSGYTYQVLVKYITEPGTLSGNSPHAIAIISGGSWGSLGEGIYLLSPTNYSFSIGASPDTASFNWAYTQTNTAYNLILHRVLSYTTHFNNASSGKVATPSASSSTAYTTATPTGDALLQWGPLNRLFKSYTIGSTTLTLYRASDFPFSSTLTTATV